MCHSKYLLYTCNRILSNSKLIFTRTVFLMHWRNSISEKSVFHNNDLNVAKSNNCLTIEFEGCKN